MSDDDKTNKDEAKVEGDAKADAKSDANKDEAKKDDSRSSDDAKSDDAKSDDAKASDAKANDEPTASESKKADEPAKSETRKDDDKAEAKAKTEAKASETKKDGDKAEAKAKTEAKAGDAKKDDDKAAAKSKDEPKAKADSKKGKNEEEEEKEREEGKKKAGDSKPAVNPKAKWTLFLIVSVASLVADQGTKIWAKHALGGMCALTEGGQPTGCMYRNPSRDPEYAKELEARIPADTPANKRQEALRALPCSVPSDLIVREVPQELRRGKDDKHWSPCRSQPTPVISNYWDWELSMNPGSAFGLFSGQGFARVFLSIVGIAAVAGMLWMLKKSRADQKILHWALALVAGGAVGNLIDRIVDSVVTDFILWHYHDKRWPVFNVADIVLVVGVGLMFIDIQKEGKREKAKKARRKEARRRIEERAKAAGMGKKLSDD